MMRALFTAFLSTVTAVTAIAQTPQPFPRAGGAQTQKPAPPAAPAPAPSAAVQPGQAPASAPSPPLDPNAPTAATLGVAAFPGSQFFSSYEAGRAQRYYIFGTTASFAEVTAYYRTQTGERGELVFKDPPTHMFTGGTLARYRDETMAFPPSVTVKDWTTSGGYPNPKIGGQPQRFPTIIMIVPAPAGTPTAR